MSSRGSPAEPSLKIFERGPPALANGVCVPCALDCNPHPQQNWHCVEVKPGHFSAAVIDVQTSSSPSTLVHPLFAADADSRVTRVDIVQNSSTVDNINLKSAVQCNGKPHFEVGSSAELDGTVEQNGTTATATTDGGMDGSAVDLVENANGEPSRGAWGSKLEFLMTMIGNAVGLGNVWRFPYLCYRNGGGAFLVPYFLMLLVVAMPLHLLESAVGQFGGVGITLSFGRAVPLSKGVGLGGVVITGVCAVYYNVIIAECLYFFVASIPGAARVLGLGNQSPDAHWTDLPWTHCDPAWATASCRLLGATSENETRNESIKAPAEEYFERQVLHLTSGMHEMGGINWQLLGANLVMWVVCGLILVKGVKSLGKVVYFTSLLPYVLLFVLLLRGLTLPGAMDGLLYYVKPDFTRLLDRKVWCDAATQVFYSTSVASGILLALSSFNGFRSNVYRDTVIVCLVDSLTSVFAGGVVFSVLGFMAAQKNVSIEEVTTSGPGLVFQVYPEALSRMAVPHLWSALFFLMMLILGLSSQFPMVEAVVSSVLDELNEVCPKALSRRAQLLIRLAFFVLFFVAGIPLIMEGGMYVLQILDNFNSGFPMLSVAILECLTFAWFYGWHRLARDMELMCGRRPNIFWRVCLQYLTPLVTLVLFAVGIVEYTPLSYGSYTYSGWAEAFCWLVAAAPISPMLIWPLYLLMRRGFDLLLLETTKSEKRWGPQRGGNVKRTEYIAQLAAERPDARYYRDTEHLLHRLRWRLEKTASILRTDASSTSQSALTCSENLCANSALDASAQQNLKIWTTPTQTHSLIVH